jgi:hypothetical protein
MKHGRRHTSLKEKTYRDRAAQGAPGYKRPYDPIDVAEPTAPIKPAPAPETPLVERLGRKEKKRLQHLGIDPDALDE